MKLLKNEKTENYHEIEIEYLFLFIKWKVKYRKIGNTTYKFSPPNNYSPTGVLEHLDISPLFNTSTT